MDEQTKSKLLEKNQKLIDMVIERAKRDFPEDIALIGLTGSFSTGDFHEKSDLDLIIINNTDRGWEIARCFILDDVGYDIYCTPWNTRIDAQSKLESNMVSCLVDLQVLYYAKPEDLARYQAYRQKALNLLAKPIGKECMDRAWKNIGEAKKCYADALLATETGPAKYAAGGVLYETINALTNLNNTYIKRGIKRYMEIVHTYQYVPGDFDALYAAVIEADTVEQAQLAAGNMLRALLALYENVKAEHVDAPVPQKERLKGTYEELWCNCRNKVISSTQAGDVSYAFHAALGAQAYLDEMTAIFGTQKFDVMRHFNACNLDAFREAFLGIMEEYRSIYDKLGLAVEQYNSFQALYEAFMQ